MTATRMVATTEETPGCTGTTHPVNYFTLNNNEDLTASHVILR
jgi:hypothetical protein